jgi:hypothetical protein
MSYADDVIYQAIQKTRTPEALENAIKTAWNKWSNWVRIVNIAPILTHYRPFRGGRVTLKACAIQKDTGEFIREITFFLQIYPAREAALSRVEKEVSRQHIPPPLFIPQLHAVLWTVPNIPRLRKLTELMKHDNFHHLLLPEATEESDILCEQPPKLVRLVPRKRAILTWNDPRTQRSYFVKLFNKSDAARAANNFKLIMNTARQERFGFLVPEVIHYNSSCRTILLTTIPGKNFTTEMVKTVPASFGRVGRALGQLHESQAKPESVQHLKKELESIIHHMDEVKLAKPGLTGRLDTIIHILAEKFDNLSCPAQCSIHGNLFGDQILYDQDTIGIVDWDAFCIGDPLFDLGRLIAHLLFLAGTERLPPLAVKTCVEAFLLAYQDRVGHRVNRQWLNWHVTAQLLMRGKITALRKLPAGWIRQLTFVVEEAAKLAHGRSDYLDLPALTIHE